MHDPMVLDLEWDGNDPAQRLLVLGINGTAWPADRIPPAVYQALRAEDIPKITFTKADHRWLRKHGVTVRGPIIDVQVMAWTYDERTPLSLDFCSKEYLGLDPDKRIYREKGVVLFRCDDGTGVPLADAPLDQLCAYNERDLFVTLKLFEELRRRLQAAGLHDYWATVQYPLSPVLLDMELNGLPIDISTMNELREELTISTHLQDTDLKRIAKLPAEFNLNSHAQMAEFLFREDFVLKARLKLSHDEMALAKDGQWPDAVPTSFDIEKLGRDYLHGKYELKGLGLKAKVKAVGCQKQTCSHADDEHIPSVSSKVLKVQYPENPWVQAYCEYRLRVKALSFLESWAEVQENGRIYTHFNQTGTATGRLSSSDPLNLQNIPARGQLGQRIRSLFKPEAGNVFVNGDFSQIEPRLMAHVSRDKALMRVFNEGLDLYEETTTAILGERFAKGSPERQLIKTCFLALGYGAQPKKIRNVLAEDGWVFPLWQVERAHRGITELYSGFWKWKAGAIAKGRELGYVETIGGHRRHLTFDPASAWKAELQAVNSEIQGGAADIVSGTMVLAANAFPTWRMILQVHDEIMFEAPADAAGPDELARFKDLAEAGHGYKLLVPIVFEPKVIENWGAK